MASHTVVICIGRNVNGKEMRPAMWASFKRTVMVSLEQSGCSVVQRPQMGEMRAHDQIGEWYGEREHAVTFVALIDGYSDITTLRNMLQMDARAYQQEAIGCIVVPGIDHLVTP